MNIDIILSMFLGFTLALGFYLLFGFNKKYRGPNSKDIVDKVYKLDNKCYMFEPVIHICK